MGIPITSLIQTTGEINTMDCIGCGRCVSVCPQNVLEIQDVKNYIPNFFSLGIFSKHSLPRDILFGLSLGTGGSAILIGLPRLFSSIDLKLPLSFIKYFNSVSNLGNGLVSMVLIGSLAGGLYLKAKGSSFQAVDSPHSTKEKSNLPPILAPSVFVLLIWTIMYHIPSDISVMWFLIASMVFLWSVVSYSILTFN